MTHGYTAGTGTNPERGRGPGMRSEADSESTPAYGIPQQRQQEPELAPESASAPAKGKGGGRDRYLDLLRSIALVRVVVYHLFGWAWLSVLFPSMGVMFALAGSLMARSLNRPALGVIKGRLRRLLPPL